MIYILNKFYTFWYLYKLVLKIKSLSMTMANQCKGKWNYLFPFLMKKFNPIKITFIFSIYIYFLPQKKVYLLQVYIIFEMVLILKV